MGGHLAGAGRNNRHSTKKKALTELIHDAPGVDEPLQNLDPENAVASLLKRFAELPGGIEAPSQLFTLLVDQLGITKGALLLPDYDGEHLAPWVLRDIDRTSEHRLRLPVSIISPMGAASVGIVEGRKLEAWKQYFSFREASMLKRIAVIPFCTKSEVTAVVLVMDCPYLSVESIAIKLIISAIREPAQTLLSGNHEMRRRAGYRHVLQTIEEVVARITEQRNTSDVSTVRVVTIGTDTLTGSICGTYEGADRYRVGQDVLRIIGSMLDGTASVGPVDRRRFAIVISNDCTIDGDLLIHQLTVGLAELFQEAGTGLNLNPRYIEITRQTDSIAELLRSG